VHKKLLVVLVLLGLLIVVLTAAVTFYQNQRLEELNYKIAELHSPTDVRETSVAAQGETTQSQTQSPSQSNTIAALTPTEQFAMLQQQIDDLSKRLSQLEKKAGVQTTTKQGNSTVKEYIVFMGTGQTNNRDWTNITSAATTINTANYGQLKAVYFEAALSIIGGEAHARIANQTTGQPLYQTEVFNNTSSADWITSASFIPAAGQNSYIVQMRSSSGEMAILNGARVHLYLQ
jgi:hypothetical protein